MLMPHITFNLVFVCRHLPSWFHNMKLYMHKTDEGRVTIATEQPQNSVGRIVGVKVHCGDYLSLQDHHPDLVIGFKPNFRRNASTWRRILPKLQCMQAPVYFCELSRFRCVSGEEVVRAAGGAVSELTINPFHCPLRITGGDNRLPKYNNAFIFHLVRPPKPGEKTEESEDETEE
ncbi:hypothetical protein WMY93_014917 [Mugilogobius chulae]|uniref:Mitochondrial splicing suppressor 51-like C-terminal domain-containing protein n=1 Tax=Mugilogobius chulae TaxID=88201 RepID=A0AAW0P6L7_9GOBI